MAILDLFKKGITWRPHDVKRVDECLEQDVNVEQEVIHEIQDTETELIMKIHDLESENNKLTAIKVRHEKMIGVLRSRLNEQKSQEDFVELEAMKKKIAVLQEEVKRLKNELESIHRLNATKNELIELIKQCISRHDIDCHEINKNHEYEKYYHDCELDDLL